jgi:hypothetical protein
VVLVPGYWCCLASVGFGVRILLFLCNNKLCLRLVKASQPGLVTCEEMPVCALLTGTPSVTLTTTNSIVGVIWQRLVCLLTCANHQEFSDSVLSVIHNINFLDKSGRVTQLQLSAACDAHLASPFERAKAQPPFHKRANAQLLPLGGPRPWTRYQQRACLAVHACGFDNQGSDPAAQYR